MTLPIMKKVSSQVFCLLLVFPVAAQQPTKALSEYEVVSRLQSRDFDQMAEALNTLRLENTDAGFSSWTLVAGSEAGPGVRAALIDALTYNVEQYGSWLDGKPHDAAYVRNIPDGWGPDLITYVVALKDEASIPVLLQATGYGPGHNGALLDFGPMVVTPAIQCAEDETGWTGAVDGCMRFLSSAAYVWQGRLGDDEMVRLQALVRKHLSRPLADYRSEYTGVMYVQRASTLALVMGWTDEFRAQAHARLEEMDPVKYDWERESILNRLSGKTLEYFIEKYGIR